jgi:ROS/MUCR transcriptional regulator protein
VSTAAVLEAPPKPIHKTPESVLARNRTWRHKNAEKVRANKRARRQANLKEARAKEHIAAQQKRELRRAENPGNSDGLELRRNDPLREEHIGRADLVMCRECGDERKRLQDHIRKLHNMTLGEYLEKWNNPPLFAPDSGKNISRHRKKWASEHGGDYFSGKRRELKPGEGTGARQNQPPTPAMKRQWLRMTGKPRPDPSDKFWSDCAAIVELWLAGESARVIAAHFGWKTPTPVTSRLKYLGFPSGHSYRFLHGEVITKKSFRDLCEDFGVSTRIIIEEIGEDFSSLRPTNVLTTKRADLILAVRKRWIDKYCIKTFGKKRVREFLASELRDLPKLRAALSEPIRALRVWLRAENSNVQPRDVLKWICKQSCEEVATSKIVGETDHRFRALVFLWPALKNLKERRPGFLEGTRTVHKVVDELLSSEYDAAARRITQTVSGELTPLDPRTLGQTVRAHLSKGDYRPLRKRGAQKKAEAEKEYFYVGEKVEEAIPIFEKLIAAKRALPKRIRNKRNHLKRELLNAGFAAEQVDTALVSRTPIIAARRYVSNTDPKNRSFDVIAEYHRDYLAHLKIQP